MIQMIRQKIPSEINILKVLFPTVSVLIFFLIFFSIRNVPEAEYLNKSSPPINKFSSVDIKNGEIFGLTQDKDSFYFTSSNILYSNLSRDEDYNMTFDDLSGTIEYSKEDILFAKSPKAKFFFKEKKIKSKNNFFSNNDESVLGKSINLEIDLETGILLSKGPTLISGPKFFITSQYLKLRSQKAEKNRKKPILHFDKNVHALVWPRG